MSKHWKIYDPDRPPARRKATLPPPPPWRQPGAARHKVTAETFQATTEVIDAVNVALHLRRPLLITGNPGTGKSSLAYAVAKQLGLGDVLVWAINSRTTLADGLYRYDALARLQQIQEQRARGEGATPARGAKGSSLRTKKDDDNIGAFITLGALGTALAAEDAPRALLIDEIDKSDVDLPNDLLSVLDTGSFPIPELQRVVARQPTVPVRDTQNRQVTVKRGVVSFTEFPVIVMTSNGERDFPVPFLRRCVQCKLPDPTETQLHGIIKAHFKALKVDAEIKDLVKAFVGRREAGRLATDQLLNAQHLAALRRNLTEDERNRVVEVLFKSLSD